MSAKRAKKTSAKGSGRAAPAPKAAKKVKKGPVLKIAPEVPSPKKGAPAKKAVAPAKAKKKAVKKAAAPKKVPKAAAKATPKKKPEVPQAKPVKKAPEANRESKMKSEGSVETAIAKKPTVLRVAAGQRKPKILEAAPAPEPVAAAKVVVETKTRTRKGGRVLELNPRVESSRGLLPKVEQGQKPMSAAERTRAAAEAAFAQVAPKLKETPAPPPVTTTPKVHKSEFELRISERDSLTTQLRLTADDGLALAAAQELAQRFKLPPDQSLLVRILGLGDQPLAKLALEELLELNDRGRVRKTDDLVQAITKLSSKDHEIQELRELFLEKLGPRA
jgi:hypothetical protein